MGKTTIKSTMIIDEFVHHPGSGRATDYQNDVATCRSPSIPEVLQGRDKGRAHSIHPRQFVEKNHLAFYLGQRIEIRNQQEKAIIGYILRRFKPIIHIFKYYWLNSTFLSANNAYFPERAKALKEYLSKQKLRGEGFCRIPQFGIRYQLSHVPSEQLCLDA